MKTKIDPDSVPSNDVVKQARALAGLTQEQAARLVHLSNYQRWAEYERGTHNIDLARWELFLILTNQHPVIAGVNRRAVNA